MLSALGDPATACPPGWKTPQTGGYCYKYFDQKMTWADAERTCRNERVRCIEDLWNKILIRCLIHQANLVSIHGDYDEKYLEEFWFKNSPLMPIWLGGKVRQGGDGINPNHWEWSDGTKWDYTHWGTGEPNGRQTGEISRLSLVELPHCWPLIGRDFHKDEIFSYVLWFMVV